MVYLFASRPGVAKAVSVQYYCILADRSRPWSPRQRSPACETIKPLPVDSNLRMHSGIACPLQQAETTAQEGGDGAPSFGWLCSEAADMHEVKVGIRKARELQIEVKPKGRWKSIQACRHVNVIGRVTANKALPV
ncbi:hypothetical protein R1sor_009627 [Riccia sorocarpa]|uniref:Uncharacterized protein n=1 Tax=Riccia sorocarpa TaxID=122646 RepID=A0ABD3HX62_9MARC